MSTLHKHGLQASLGETFCWCKYIVVFLVVEKYLRLIPIMCIIMLFICTTRFIENDFIYINVALYLTNTCEYLCLASYDSGYKVYNSTRCNERWDILIEHNTVQLICLRKLKFWKYLSGKCSVFTFCQSLVKQSISFQMCTVYYWKTTFVSFL